MKYGKIGDKLIYVGGWGWDLTVAPEEQQLTDVEIIRDGTGGWDWWVRDHEGEEFMADECQLRREPDEWKAQGRPALSALH